MLSEKEVVHEIDGALNEVFDADDDLSDLDEEINTL